MSRVVIMGSGETAPTMVKPHREILARCTGPAVMLDTTFGFQANADDLVAKTQAYFCLLYTSPSPRDRTRSRMPSSA